MPGVHGVSCPMLQVKLCLSVLFALKMSASLWYTNHVGGVMTWVTVSVTQCVSSLLEQYAGYMLTGTMPVSPNLLSWTMWSTLAANPWGVRRRAPNPQGVIQDVGGNLGDYWIRNIVSLRGRGRGILHERPRLALKAGPLTLWDNKQGTQSRLHGGSWRNGYRHACMKCSGVAVMYVWSRELGTV